MLVRKKHYAIFITSLPPIWNFIITLTVMMRKIRYIGEISLKIFKWSHNMQTFKSVIVLHWLRTRLGFQKALVRAPPRSLVFLIRSVSNIKLGFLVSFMSCMRSGKSRNLQAIENYIFGLRNIVTGQRSRGFQGNALKKALQHRQLIPKTANLTCKQKD